MLRSKMNDHVTETPLRTCKAPKQKMVAYVDILKNDNNIITL
jgi:hypothetical protein